MEFGEFKQKYEDVLKDSDIHISDEELAKMYIAIYVVSDSLVKDIVKNFNDVWKCIGR